MDEQIATSYNGKTVARIELYDGGDGETVTIVFTDGSSLDISSRGGDERSWLVIS